MQVISCESHLAICDNQGVPEQVDLALVGPQQKGTWLLVFLGAAREVMEPAEALTTLNAINAMQSIMQGDTDIDHMFADLIDREPLLPPHLQQQIQQNSEETATQDNSHAQLSGVKPNAKPFN